MTTTVNSVPASFVITNSAGGWQTVTFAIPPLSGNSYTAATWQATGSSTNASTDTATTLTGGGHAQAFGAKSGAGAFSETVSASTQQLADINAAQGSTISVQLSTSDTNESVTSFQLVLTGSPPGPGSGGGRDITPPGTSSGSTATGTTTLDIPVVLPEVVPRGILYDDAFKHIQLALGNGGQTTINNLQVVPPALDSTWRFVGLCAIEPTCGGKCLTYTPSGALVAVWEYTNVTSNERVAAMSSTDGGKTWLSLDGTSQTPTIIYDSASVTTGIPNNTCPVVGVDAQNNLYILYITVGGSITHNSGTPCTTPVTQPIPSIISMQIWGYGGNGTWSPHVTIPSIEAPLGNPEAPYVSLTPPVGTCLGVQTATNQNALRGQIMPTTQGYMVATYYGYGQATHIGSISCYPDPPISPSAITTPYGTKAQASPYANTPFLVQAYDFNGSGQFFHGGQAQEIIQLDGSFVMAIFEYITPPTNHNKLAYVITQDVVNWPGSLSVLLASTASILPTTGLVNKQWDACWIQGTTQIAVAWVDDNGLGQGLGLWLSIFDRTTLTASTPVLISNGFINETCPQVQCSDGVLRVLWMHQRDETPGSGNLTMSMAMRSCASPSAAYNPALWTSAKYLPLWETAQSSGEPIIQQVSACAQGVVNLAGNLAWPVIFNQYDGHNLIGEVGFKPLWSPSIDS